jgi:hypothetical protein
VSQTSAQEFDTDAILGTPTLEDLIAEAKNSEELVVQAARTNVNVFIEYVLKDPANGKRVIQAPHHLEWQRLCNAHKNLVLTSAVELGKTQNVVLGRTLWLIGRNPNLRLAIIAATKESASKLMLAITTYIDQSPELHRVFPNLKRDKSQVWNTSKATVIRDQIGTDSTLSCYGTGAEGIIGARWDGLILDDILTYDNTRTPEGRKATYDWMMGTLMGRLVDGAFVLAIGNAFHPEDALHRLAASPGWVSKKYPVYLDDGVTPRWPQRWPVARIEARRAMLPPHEFARQMLCQPKSAHDAVFREEYIHTALRRAVQVGHRHMVPSLQEVPRGCRTITGVDLAVSLKDSADNTSLTTILLKPNLDREVLWVEFGKYDANETVRRIIEANRRYKSTIIVENNAAQDYMRQMVKNTAPHLPIFGFTTTASAKNHSAYGIAALSDEFARGMWLLPNDEGQMADGVQQLVSELRAYDPKAHTGDVLMSCVPPGYPVMTASGPKPVEEVVTGDLVLTHRGRWRPVTSTMSRDYDGDLAVIKPRGMLPIALTANHPVWRAPARLETQDRTNRLVPKEWLWTNAEFLRAGRKLAGDYILQPVPAGWPGAACPIRDFDEAMLVGLYLAEGSAAHHQVNFALHRRETYLAEFITAQMSRLWGCKTSVYDRKKYGGGQCIVVVSHSKAARDWFKQFNKHSKKGLPWAWMGMRPDLAEGVLRGWLMGDGCYSGPPGRRTLGGVSISRTMISQLRLLAHRSGLKPSEGKFIHTESDIQINGVPCRQRQSWVLKLTVTDTHRLLSRMTCIERERWGCVPSTTREVTNGPHTFVEAGVATRLGSVTFEHYTGPVYNFHVEEDESYTVGGIAVHNCWLARQGIEMAEANAVRSLNLDVLRR